MKHRTYPHNKYEKVLLDIRDMILNGEVNVVVPQTVYKEIKRGKEIDHGTAQNFLNMCCEILQPTQYEKDKAFCVTDAYGNVPIDNRTAMYLAEDYTQKNYKDALILAELSVEQKSRGKRIPFITANLRDVHDITRINKVNVRHGLPELFICSPARFKDAYYFAKREDNEHDFRR